MYKLEIFFFPSIYCDIYIYIYEKRKKKKKNIY